MSVTMRKILVPVDGSENGERAVRTAIGFARDYHAELEVLRVVQCPSGVTTSSPRDGGAGSAILNERYDHAEVFLAANGKTLDIEVEARVLTGIREGFYQTQEVVEWLRGHGIKQFVRP
ncbi:MAG: universal stress protein [archaeon]|nr:MAG: universal stress protein [archaeon]